MILDQHQLMIRDMARSFAHEQLAPFAAEWDREERFPSEAVAAMGELGLLGMLVPQEWGGAGVDFVSYAAAVEEIAAGDGSCSTIMAVHNSVACMPVHRFGSEAQKRRWLHDLASGKVLGAFCLSEPGAGSDAAALALRADPDGAGWRLTGEKMWISNAPDADVYSVFARTTPDARARGVTAFAVPGDSDGLSGEPLDMLSPHPIGHLVFDGVYVGPDAVLGEVDGGFAVATRTLDLFRPSVGAYAVGMGQAALDATVAHVRTRHVYGGPLARQQAVAHRIADMATQLEAARLLVYGAAAAYDAGDRPQDQSRRSAMAKLFATEAAQQIVDGCVQLHGAVALRSGHLLEQLYRDVRSLRIYEGASEIQRTIIARELIGMDATR
jgi:acyl-CoA dehydrogenase